MMYYFQCLERASERMALPVAHAISSDGSPRHLHPICQANRAFGAVQVSAAKGAVLAAFIALIR